MIFPGWGHCCEFPSVLGGASCTVVVSITVMDILLCLPKGVQITE